MIYYIYNIYDLLYIYNIYTVCIIYYMFIRTGKFFRENCNCL